MFNPPTKSKSIPIPAVHVKKNKRRVRTALVEETNDFEQKPSSQHSIDGIFKMDEEIAAMLTKTSKNKDGIAEADNKLPLKHPHSEAGADNEKDNTQDNHAGKQSTAATPKADTLGCSSVPKVLSALLHAEQAISSPNSHQQWHEAIRGESWQSRAGSVSSASLKESKTVLNSQGTTSPATSECVSIQAVSWTKFCYRQHNIKPPSTMPVSKIEKLHACMTVKQDNVKKEFADLHQEAKFEAQWEKYMAECGEDELQFTMDDVPSSGAEINHVITEDDTAGALTLASPRGLTTKPSV